MWNDFCGNLIRRGNRNTLIAALVLLAMVGGVAYYNARYLKSFFSPVPTVAPEALPTADPTKLTDTFVKMNVQDSIATGVQHITKDDSHPGGVVDSLYIATVAGGKLLIVRVAQAPLPSGPDAAQGALAPASLEGRFARMDSQLQSNIQDSIHGAIVRSAPLPPLLPVYLDTVDYKSNGYVMLVFGIPLLLLALWLLWRFQQFTGDFTRHPFATRLARYGQLEMLIHEVDSEVAGAHTEYGRMSSALILTPHWLICRGPWGGTPIRFDHLVWMYRHVTKRKILLFITVSKWHSLIAYDDFGNKTQTRLKEQQVTDAMRDLAIRAPQAILGYDKRLQKLWKSLGKDKSRFLTEARTIIPPQEILKDKTSTLWNA